MRSRLHVKLRYRCFESSSKSWDVLCQEVTTWVNGQIRTYQLDHKDIVNISMDAAGPQIGSNGIIVVWYWAQDEE